MGVDVADFERELEPLLNPAFRLAVTMLGDREAAEDAVQEAALRAWRGYHRFREGSPLRPWFLTIVANQCRSTRGSPWWGVRRPVALLAQLVQPDRFAAVDERLDLDAALERLPRARLLPLVLHYHLDLPIAEVALVLGCSEGAARVRLHRALGSLRSGLATEVTG